jgi:hypothetical protein
MAKVRIVSNGTAAGTTLSFVAADGTETPFGDVVSAVTWTADGSEGIAKCLVTFALTEVDVIGDTAPSDDVLT